MFLDNDERCFLITIGGSSTAPSGLRSVPRRFRVVEVKVFARDLCADFDSRPGPFGHPVRSRSATGPPGQRKEADAFRRVGRRWRSRDVEGHGVEDSGAQVDPTVVSSSSAVLVAGVPLEVWPRRLCSASYPLGTRWAAPGRCSLAPDRPGQNRHMLRQPTLIRRFLVSGCGWCSCSSLVRRGLRDSPTAWCALGRFEPSGIFPISYVQVDTAGVATDPNIAGSRPRRIVRTPRFKPLYYRLIAHADWPDWPWCLPFAPFTSHPASKCSRPIRAARGTGSR